MTHIFTQKQAEDLQKECHCYATNGAGDLPKMRVYESHVWLDFNMCDVPCRITIRATHRGEFLVYANFRQEGIKVKSHLVIPVEPWPGNHDYTKTGLAEWKFYAAFRAAKAYLWDCLKAERNLTNPPLPPHWKLDGKAYQLDGHPEIEADNGCEVTWEDDNPVFFVVVYDDDWGQDVVCDWKAEFMEEDTCDFLSPEAEAKNLYVCLEEITQWMTRQYPSKQVPSASRETVSHINSAWVAIQDAIASFEAAIACEKSEEVTA